MGILLQCSESVISERQAYVGKTLLKKKKSAQYGKTYFTRAIIGDKEPNQLTLMAYSHSWRVWKTCYFPQNTGFHRMVMLFHFSHKQLMDLCKTQIKDTNYFPLLPNCSFEQVISALTSADHFVHSILTLLHFSLF